MAQEVISPTDPIMTRLEEQIDWYDRKSISSKRIYKRIKVTEILAAALIPFISGLSVPHGTVIAGGLGVVITVLEGLIHLNQYQQNWISYRATCEALRHEKYVYLGGAPPYDGPGAHVLLVQRVESLVSQEHSKWESSQSADKKN
jgi:hypothetical protein